MTITFKLDINELCRSINLPPNLKPVTTSVSNVVGYLKVEE